MNSHLRRYCLAAAALVGLAGPAAAQTWTYEPDYAARAYYAPRAYQTVVTDPFAVATTQRTVINRTIIPQGRGRAPIVKERIVSESVAPRVVRERVVARPVVAESYAYAPVRDRVVTRPAVWADDYAYSGYSGYSGYAYAPVVRERVVRRPTVVVDYSSPTDAYAMAPVATTVPAATPYRYRYINNRLLLVDPVTGAVVGKVRD
jgi:hypothetical protein